MRDQYRFRPPHVRVCGHGNLAGLFGAINDREHEFGKRFTDFVATRADVQT